MKTIFAAAAIVAFGALNGASASPAIGAVDPVSRNAVASPPSVSSTPQATGTQRPVLLSKDLRSRRR